MRPHALTSIPAIGGDDSEHLFGGAAYCCTLSSAVAARSTLDKCNLSLLAPDTHLRRCRGASWLPGSGTFNSWQGEGAWLRHREKLEQKPRNIRFSTHGALGNREICVFKLSSSVLLAGEVAYHCCDCKRHVSAGQELPPGSDGQGRIYYRVRCLGASDGTLRCCLKYTLRQAWCVLSVRCCIGASSGHCFLGLPRR